MKRLRHFAFAIGLAAALLFGQQVVVLHDLAHAKEQLSSKEAKPGSSTCEQCFTCAQLSGAVGASPPTLPVDCASHAQFDVLLAKDAVSAPLLAFRSSPFRSTSRTSLTSSAG